jgi:hypothetical protein
MANREFLDRRDKRATPDLQEALAYKACKVFQAVKVILVHVAFQDMCRI